MWPLSHSDCTMFSSCVFFNTPKMQELTPRKLIPKNSWGKFAISVSAVQLLICVFLESAAIRTSQELALNIFFDPSQMKKYRALNVYRGLFIASQFFQCILTFDAVQNMYFISHFHHFLIRYTIILRSNLS